MYHGFIPNLGLGREIITFRSLLTIFEVNNILRLRTVMFYLNQFKVVILQSAYKRFRMNVSKRSKMIIFGHF